jgi:hypothetical protein
MTGSKGQARKVVYPISNIPSLRITRELHPFRRASAVRYRDVRHTWCSLDGASHSHERSQMSSSLCRGMPVWLGEAHRIYMLAASCSVNRYNLKYRPAPVRLRMASLLTLFELRSE